MRKRIVFIFFLFIAVLYLHNLTRDIYSGDVGDIVTASCIWGVAHPPAYPLITFLGNILCHIPFPLPPVARVALVSAAASLAALIIIYKFSMRVSKNTFFALLTTSILAFSHLFWFHAEIPEVFGLNHFFVAATIYTFYLFYHTKKVRYLYIFAFVLGLSLTHHHTILLLGPSFAILFIARWKQIWKARKKWLKIIAVCVVGFVPYIYVPLAAMHHPVINWGNGYTFQNFIGILQRRAYGGFAPAVDNGIPIAVKMAIMSDYFDTLIANFSYQTVFLVILGFIYLIRHKQKTLAASFFVAWLVSGPLFVSYASTYYTTTTSIGIIERFYSMSYIPFILFTPFGLMYLYGVLKKFFSKSFYVYLLLSYFIIVPAMQLYFNYPKTDLSRTQRGNELAKDILNSVPQNAVLFTAGDTTSFNLWYVRYVLGVRNDVDIVNPPNVGGNKFIDSAVNDYKDRNPKVPLKEIFVRTLQKIREKRPIYATYVAPLGIPDSTLIPMGVTYKLVKNDKIPDKQQYIDEVETQLRKLKRPRLETSTPAERNMVATEIPLIYSNALVHIGDFVMSRYESAADAEWYYRRALWMNPENPSAYAGLSLSVFKAYKDCSQGPANMKEAIAIYPIWHTYYEQLYVLNSRCKLSNAQLELEYKKMFNDSLEKRIKTKYPKAL